MSRNCHCAFCLFSLVCKLLRKGQSISPHDFCWQF